MQSEDAPPGFWRWPGAEHVLVDGVEIDSAVPTRLFQTLDVYPREWGRLSWRIQLNKIAADRVALPVFRTFYPGVEWNLQNPDRRWFLTAWFKWHGPGPPYRKLDLPRSALIEGATASFCITWLPKTSGDPDLQRPVFLRSRVDARDRSQVAGALRPAVAPATSNSAVIVLDDVIERS